MAYYKNLLEYVEVLDREGLLFRVNRPINKDTEMHPLVRWQFRGLDEEQRRAFYFDDIYDSQGALEICYEILKNADEIETKLRDSVRMMHAVKQPVALLFTGEFTV